MADTCDCGFALRGPQTNQLMYLGSIDKSLQTIKKILVFWLVLGLLGAVIWFIVVLANAR